MDMNGSECFHSDNIYSNLEIDIIADAGGNPISGNPTTLTAVYLFY